jgi:hypothetical protein
LGYEGLFLSNVDSEENQRMKNNKDYEFNWEVSNGKSIFTSVVPDKKAEFPAEVNLLSETYINDPESPLYNAPKFIEGVQKRAKYLNSLTRTNHVFMPMGDDFTWSNAERIYTSIDKLI